MLKLADFFIDQVTGVVTKEGDADVTYTTKLELTPVAEFYAPVNNPSPGQLRLVECKWK